MFFPKKEHGLDKILAHLNNIMGSPYLHIFYRIIFGAHQNTLAFSDLADVKPMEKDLAHALPWQ